ncbi:uncharacterized protein LOC134711000 isoform X1 [Mytilus trossulus]|uniref:uncharacterized protein LOC134711000 isoform X1 n=1 Tax=Mytilus trossulus TaxID=6551 RepID=UPI0030046DB1
MKNYLPGYYLRSLRNRPLVEIDAEEISSTIQVHQYEVLKTRKRKNLKAFEEMSKSNRMVNYLENKKVRPIEVPLVQEFIRNAIDEEQCVPETTEHEEFSLTQTLNSIPELSSSPNFGQEPSFHDKDFNFHDKEFSFQDKEPSIHDNVSKSGMFDPAQRNTTSFDLPLECPRVPKIQSPCASVSTQTIIYQERYPANESRLPKAFKAKLKKNLMNSLLKSPCYNSARLTGLSYSQPSTPKTPMFRSVLCATPRMQKRRNFGTPSLSQYIPFTPMLHEAVKLLDSIPERFEENVDLLNIIDDDTKPVEMVDKEIDSYNEVNDANVADYVLNIVNDYPIQEYREMFQKVPKVEFKKRKCQRAKPIFFEESEAFKEKKREKDRERRKKKKQTFERKSPLGTRRSNRKLRPPPRV